MNYNEKKHESWLLPFSNYEKLKPVMKATIEGYISASEGNFPPHNPYAICGLYAGEEDDNILGAAWFYGFFSFPGEKLEQILKEKYGKR